MWQQRNSCSEARFLARRAEDSIATPRPRDNVGLMLTSTKTRSTNRWALPGAALLFSLMSWACTGVLGEDSSDTGGTGAGGSEPTGTATGAGTSTGTGDTSGGSTGTGTGGATSGGGDAYPPPASRGATLPFWEYEAEDASTNGVPIGPSRAFGEIAAESSGRRAVRLEATGQKVEWKTEHPTNSIVVRYVIPDAPGGGGINATIGLYINGERKQSLKLTSHYAWIYGGESNSANNTPGEGAHHFYDEVRALIGDVPAGSTIALQRDAEDTAPYYVIDLVDFELVAPPLEMPAGAISITEHGATPDDGTDDGAAIQKTIEVAKAEGKTVWIPKGTFESTTSSLHPTGGVTVRGAGMWYSTIHGLFARFNCSGNGNQFYDFAIMGEVDMRREDKAEHGFADGTGTGSQLENIWIEHTNVGYWVGNNPGLPPGTKPTDGLVIRGVRVRNTFADGVNFCNGTSNSVVEQSHFRNTGDDAVATWSPSFDGPMGEKNVFRFNTVQNPWRANCFALYGGKDHTIEDNVCSDTVMYPGIFVSSGFSAHPFAGATVVQRNTVTRAGGPMYNQEHGALKVFADQSAISNVLFKEILIEDATFSGIHVQGPSTISGLVFKDVKVTGASTAGILINSNAQGSAQADGVVISGVSTGLQNDAGDKWTFQKGGGNSGW